MPSTPSPRLGFASRTRSLRRRSSGFTLLEILVVLAIIGLIAGLAISNIDSLFGGAKIDSAKLFINQSLGTSLNAYQLHNGNYPSTAEGLQALMTAPANRASTWHGPYIKENTQMPMLDPWKEPYQYRFPGTKNKKGYDLFSKGPDGIADNEDDIGNWESAPAAAPATK